MIRSHVLIATLVALVPTAVQAANRAIAVDWSGVSDKTIAQCKLRGLEGLLVQSLIEEHFAVVDHVDDAGISVSVQATPAAFEMRVSAQGVVLHDWLEIPKPCDSSIQLDLVQRVTAMAHVIDIKTGGSPEPTARELFTPPTPTPKGKAIEAPRSRVVSRAPIEIDGEVAFPGHGTPLFGGAFRLNLDLGGPFLAIASELVFRHVQDLSIFEPGLAVGVGMPLGQSWPFAFDVGLEAAGIVHVYRSTSGGVVDTGGKLDGRLGMPVAITGGRGRITITAMPYLRINQIEHFLDGSRTYVSERWGVLLRMGVGI